MLWKLSECIKNRFYAKSYTSRPHIPKIAVKLSKMAPPDRIKYRGSLTTPIVAKGLTDENDSLVTDCGKVPTEINSFFSSI